MYFFRKTFFSDNEKDSEKEPKEKEPKEKEPKEKDKETKEKEPKEKESKDKDKESKDKDKEALTSNNQSAGASSKTSDDEIKPPSSEPEEGTMGATLWSVLSSKIGGDVLMAGISLPSWLYEPLTILQRSAEMVEYGDVLSKAAATEDPVERMAFIAGFAVSGYSATQRYKPDFNPILGETFEFVDQRNNTKFLAEQVSHHPPVSALHAMNENNWVFWQNSSPITKFLGNSIDLDTQGKSHVIFPKRNEQYFYTNPQCTRIHNIIIGSMWIEHFGTLNITNDDGSLQCTVNFKKSGIFQGCQFKVEGYITDGKGKKLVKLEGRWNENLEGKWLEDTVVLQKNETRNLWKIDRDSFLNDQYNFTQFTVSLNKMTDTEEVIVLPSDARRRLDRKNLEKGNSDTASYWKKIIEERQRTDRKSRKIPWQPIWFRKEEQANPFGGTNTVWVYDSDFWEQRARKEESVRQGDLQFILKMNPPQVLNSACDFTAYDTSSNYLQLVLPPKTETSVILLPTNNIPPEQPPIKKKKQKQIRKGSQPPAETNNNHNNTTTAPEKFENIKEEKPHKTEVNGTNHISGNETQN